MKVNKDIKRNIIQSNPNFLLKKYGVLPSVFFSFIGFLFSITQILGISPDYISYDEFFEQLRKSFLDEIVLVRFEVLFTFISLQLTNLFNSNLLVYSLFVILSMSLKGWVIQSYASSIKIFILVAIFYFVRYFPINELTQIRAAISVGFFLVAELMLSQYKSKLAILFLLLAFFFHHSSVILIPFMYLKCNKRWEILSISFFVFIFTTFFISNLITYFSSSVETIDMYQQSGFGDKELNPFSIALLIDWIIIAASIKEWHKLTPIMKRVILLELIGMAVFYGSMNYPVIAYRIRDLFTNFWILFIADGLTKRKTKLISYGVIALSVSFYYFVFFIREPSFFEK